jgi:hypothetical protein
MDNEAIIDPESSTSASVLTDLITTEKTYMHPLIPRICRVPSQYISSDRYYQGSVPWITRVGTGEMNNTNCILIHMNNNSIFREKGNERYHDHEVSANM